MLLTRGASRTALIRDRSVLFTERGDLVFGKLSQKGFEELGRRNIIKPTREQLNRRGGVCWSPPAFAYRHVFARSDAELVCFDLGKPTKK